MLGVLHANRSTITRRSKASIGSDFGALDPMRSGSVQRRAVNTPPMPVSRIFLAVLVLGAIGQSAIAAEASRQESCLTKAEQRAAVDTNRAISLGQAIKSLRQYRKYSEIVRARLCRHDEKLVYVLTLLGRSGKVVDATVDAVNGEFHTNP
jgi:hypothetical protein